MPSNQIPSLDFDLGETADLLRDTVMSFAADQIAPRAEEIDRTNEFPRDLWPRLGGAGAVVGDLGRGLFLGRHRAARNRAGDGGSAPGRLGGGAVVAGGGGAGDESRIQDERRRGLEHRRELESHLVGQRPPD